VALLGVERYRGHLASVAALKRVVRCPAIVVSLVVASLMGGDARAAWTDALERQVPLAALLRPELAQQAPGELRAYRRTLLRRLLLDEGHVAIEAPRDLHDAVLLATVSALLVGAAGEDGPARMDAVRAAYVVFMAGGAARDRGELRRGLEGLPATTKSARTRELFAALTASVAGLENVGRDWFPAALHEALDDGPGDAELHHLRGLWLEREGRAAEATNALLASVESRPTVPAMVDLYRLLVDEGRRADASTLAKALVPRAPGVAGSLQAVLERAGDGAMTAVYEDPRNQPSVDDRLAQAVRYRRSGQMERALATLEALDREAPEDVRVRELAAALWLETERFGRLAALFDTALAGGGLSRRLLEARVAAVATARLQRARGAAGHALAELEIGPDLGKLEAMEVGAATVRALELVLALAAQRSERAGVEAAIAKLGAADSTGLETSRLMAAAWLALGEPDRAMWALAQRLPGLDVADGTAVSLLLASLELNYGAKTGDRGLVARALDRLERTPEPSAVGLAALRDYHRLVAGRIGAWLRDKRGRVGAGAEDGEALEALLPLVDRLDPTVATERAAARGAALSAAAIYAWRGEREQAIAALAVARRIGPADALGWVAAGQAAVIGGDAAGALTAFDEALAAFPTARVAFVARKWAALAANRLGDAEAMREHFRAMLALWDAAGAPEVRAGDRPYVLASGEAGVAVRLEPGEPLRVAVDVAPIVVLLPDFPHDRAEIQSVVGAAEPEAGRKATP
jgi:tetratricopeptide (TPR) repeat protein